MPGRVSWVEMFSPGEPCRAPSWRQGAPSCWTAWSAVTSKSLPDPFTLGRTLRSLEEPSPKGAGRESFVSASQPHARFAGSVRLLLPVRGGMFRILAGCLATIVVGSVMVSLVPRLAAEAAEILREPCLIQSALVGLGFFILVPCAIVIAAITVIGIPLALVATALYVVLVYLGRVPIAVWIGQRVPGGLSRTGRSGALVNFHWRIFSAGRGSCPSSVGSSWR